MSRISDLLPCLFPRVDNNDAATGTENSGDSQLPISPDVVCTSKTASEQLPSCETATSYQHLKPSQKPVEVPLTLSSIETVLKNVVARATNTIKSDIAEELATHLGRIENRFDQLESQSQANLDHINSRIDLLESEPRSNLDSDITSVDSPEHLTPEDARMLLRNKKRVGQHRKV